MAKSKGKPAKGAMTGHSKASVRGPRKTGGKGGKKPSNYNSRGSMSKKYT